MLRQQRLGQGKIGFEFAKVDSIDQGRQRNFNIKIKRRIKKDEKPGSSQHAKPKLNINHNQEAHNL